MSGLFCHLACPDKRFAEWTKVVGMEYGNLGAKDKNDVIAELAAVVACLYGLREAFEEFQDGCDYEPRAKAVLNRSQAWSVDVLSEARYSWIAPGTEA